MNGIGVDLGAGVRAGNFSPLDGLVENEALHANASVRDDDGDEIAGYLALRLAMKG